MRVTGMSICGVRNGRISAVRLGSTMFNIRIGRRLMRVTIMGRLTGGHRKARGTGAHSRISNNKEGP